MSSTSVKVLVGTKITDAMVSSSTIAEPAAGETAWTSGGTYAIDVERLSTAVHGIYVCVQAHTGRTARPEADPNYWLFKQPSAKWAALDSSITTQSRAVTPLTYVFRPGFINAISLRGLDGAAATVTYKDGPGGATVFTGTYDLQEPPLDWYDWAFGRIRPLSKLVISDLLPYPDAEVTVTITAATGVEVGVAMINFGDLRLLLSDSAQWGGAEQGATVEPVSYSYIDTDKYGNTRIVDGASTAGMDIEVPMPGDVADYVAATLEELLGKPATWIATDAPGHTSLNVHGLGSGRVTYLSPGVAKLSLKVKGIVNATV